MTTPARSRYAGHRFPAEIISHAIWRYFRFPLSLRPPGRMVCRVSGQLLMGDLLASDGRSNRRSNIGHPTAHLLVSGHTCFIR